MITIVKSVMTDGNSALDLKNASRALVVAVLRNGKSALRAVTTSEETMEHRSALNTPGPSEVENVEIDTENMITARIEGWHVGTNNQLFGYAFDHPNYDDGTWIITSKIQVMDRDSGVAVTKNTRYLLGTPSEEYANGY